MFRSATTSPPSAAAPSLAKVWILLVGLIFVAIAIGPAGWYAPWDLHNPIVALRAPRILISAIVGASLATAGAAMQSLLRNDLADPYILGLAGGASAGAVMSLALAPGIPPGPAAALGAGVAATTVQKLAKGPFDPSRLLLCGVAVSSLLLSLTGLVLVLAPADQLLRSSTFWLFGGFGSPQFISVGFCAAIFVAAYLWLSRHCNALDRLLLGDDVALSMGVDLGSVKRGIMVASILLTAASVCVGGLIGFVGMIAPHFARLRVGASHHDLLPAAAIYGAVLVVFADIVARCAFAPREVPVGLLIAVLGGPFFLHRLQKGMA